jgi:acetolactate synthase-1/2/3 large subunit
LGTPESELLKEVCPKRIIHLDVEESKFASEFNLQVAIVSSIRGTLTRLTTLLKNRVSHQKRDVAEEIARNRLNVKRERKSFLEENEKAKPIHPAVVVDKLRKTLEEDATVISDIGMCQAWLSDFFEVYTPNSYFDPGSYGSMGFALPAAIAAKVLFPERHVVAVAGDGGFLMSLQEFQTAVENKLNIIIVVLNDSKYNSLWHIQKSKYNERFIAVDMHQTDFSKYAEIYGAKGIRIEEPSDLKQGYEEALCSRTPAIIDVVIDNRYYPTEYHKLTSHKRHRLNQTR